MIINITPEEKDLIIDGLRGKVARYRLLAEDYAAEYHETSSSTVAWINRFEEKANKIIKKLEG